MRVCECACFVLFYFLWGDGMGESISLKQIRHLIHTLGIKVYMHGKLRSQKCWFYFSLTAAQRYKASFTPVSKMCNKFQKVTK